LRGLSFQDWVRKAAARAAIGGKTMSKSLTIAALLASLTLGGCLGGTGGGQSIDLSSYERGKLHYNAGQFGA
jgi:hypothetical protein